MQSIRSAQSAWFGHLEALFAGLKTRHMAQRIAETVPVAQGKRRQAVITAERGASN